MAKNKDQLLAQATELGIDPATLPQDGQDGPSNTTLEEAIAAATGEVPVTADQFVAQGGPGVNVPLSGLLAERLELRDAELKPSEWQQLLDEYLKSERP